MAKSAGNVGRPAIEFDLEIVEGLGRIGATAAEMAYVLPPGRSTIEHRMADPTSDFHKAYRKGQSLLKASLRRKQIAVAMAGNVTMLIWLGKQHLARQDRMTVNPEESREFIDKLGAAGDAAREAGDDAAVAAAVSGSPMGSGPTSSTSSGSGRRGRGAAGADPAGLGVGGGAGLAAG